MEWQQPSRLLTTSSGDICKPACKLHKHQRVSSGLSYLYKESSVYTLWQEEKSLGRVWEEFEQRIADGPGKGSRNCKNDLCERARKETPWFRPENVLWKCFWNRRPDGIVINKNHQTLYILECKRSSDRNEDFLEVKKEEANEQHTIIIEVLRAAAPAWTFEQIRWQGSVVQ